MTIGGCRLEVEKEALHRRIELVAVVVAERKRAISILLEHSLFPEIEKVTHLFLF